MKLHAVAFAFLIGALLPAHAATYDFAFSTNQLSANGTLTTGAASGGGFDITDITGSITVSGLSDTALDGTFMITGLLEPGTCCGSEPNDNILFYPTTPYLDAFGLAFAANGDEISLFADGGAYSALDSSRTIDVGDGAGPQLPSPPPSHSSPPASARWG